jgi:hypothetical protein
MSFGVVMTACRIQCGAAVFPAARRMTGTSGG